MAQLNNKILAVVVIYKEQLSNSVTYNSLYSSLQLLPSDWSVNLFIYDNSPSSQDCHSELLVKYVHDENNSGLSRAYNSAAAFAQNYGYDWLLLLDQDTFLPNDFFFKTTTAVKQNQNESLFAPLIKSQNGLLISPFRMVGKIGVPLSKIVLGSISSKDYAVINSGIMVSVNAFYQVGGYCDHVKLDFSDTVFLERFSKHRGSLFVTEIICQQQLSTFIVNKKALQHRFALFCQGAKFCPKEGLRDRLDYLIVVVKRLARLITNTKSLTFIKIFYINYVKR